MFSFEVLLSQSEARKENGRTQGASVSVCSGSLRCFPGVAMMAALGAVVQHYVKFPGFDSVPTGLAASITAPGSSWASLPPKVIPALRNFF